MRKYLSAMLVLLILLSTDSSLAAQEEEVSIFFPPSPTPQVSAIPDSDLSTATQAPAHNATQAQTDGSIIVTVSALGDLTFGGDVRKGGLSIFDKELKRQGGDLGFVTRNIRSLLAEDDMTIVNFETTLTTAPVFKKGNEFVFSAPPEYIDILTEGSIEAVSFENNHALDHGQAGIDETTANFDQHGIVWSSEGRLGVFETKGIRIGMLAYQTFNNQYPRLFELVPQDIAKAKMLCDIVMVSYHWGDELDYVPNANQQKLGRLTIDAGADLVVGHHSHRINPIEEYNGKYIVYSLANFSFAGNNKPSDMSSFVFQMRFQVKDGVTTGQGFRVIPMRISSKSDYNDFMPTPFTEQRHIDNVINTMLANGKKLEFAVTSYPVDWE